MREDRPHAAVFRDRTIELAQRLVREPSENPPGDVRGPAAVAAGELRVAGFQVRLVEDEPGFVNVIAEHAFSATGPTLMFNGHLDVVPAGRGDEWSRDPWAAELADGRLYGRGSLDMKGAIAAVIVAAGAAVGRGDLHGKLIVTAVADEEQGGHRGTGMLARRGLLEADGAVVVEPGDGGLVVAHRGLCFLELVAYGRAAHASQPAGGINAVGLMADVLHALASIDLMHTPHPLLGGPTIVAGTTIHGGEAPNVIPGQCTATIDVRTVPGMTRESILEDIEAHLRVSGLDTQENVRVTVMKWGEPAETPHDARIVEVSAAAFADEFGTAPEIRGMSAYTDGGWLANVCGIPTIMAFGPGAIAGCHVVDECVEVTELERYARVYHGVIERFLRR